MAVKKGSARWKAHRKRVAKVQVEKARARDMGLTIEQYRDKNTPLSLKPRTEDWVQRQAKARVDLAYEGAEKALTGQEAAAKHLADKRAADDKWYADWIAQAHDKMVSASKAAGETMFAQQQQLAQQQAQRYAQSAAAGVQAANERAGNVSNNAGSTTLQNQGAANAAADQQANAAAGLSSQAAEGSAHAQRLATANNAYASLGAASTKKAHNEDMREINKQRGQLGAQKSKDYVETLAALFTEQTNKAASAREFQAAAASLGIDQAKLALSEADTLSKIKDRKSDNKLNREKYENPNTKPAKKKASDRVKYAKKVKPIFIQKKAATEENIEKHADGIRYLRRPGAGAGGADQYVALTPKNFAQVRRIAEAALSDRVLGMALAQQLVYGRVYEGTWQAIRKMGINPKGLGLKYGGKAK